MKALAPTLAGLPPAFETLFLNVREEMLKDYGVDSCIAGTRIAVDLLDRMGIAANGVHVKMAAYNPVMATWIRRGRSPKDALTVGGAWSVGVVELHLVAWVARLPGSSRALLVDLSLDQASRPAKGMPLTPLISTIPRGMADAFGTGGLVFAYPNGSVVAYVTSPGNDSWLGSPNWGDRDLSVRGAIIERAIARTKISRADRRRLQRDLGRVWA